MIANVHYDQCLSFLNSEIAPNARKPARQTTRFRSVTLSRDAGSGGNTVAEMLIEKLKEKDPKAPRPWTLFNRNLIEQVMQDHNLPTRLAKFFPEDRLTELEDMMDEIVGLRPGSWTVVEKTTETILRLAALGNVVIVGRAGNIVTRKLPDVLSVRLTGSVETRVRRLSETRGMTRKFALDFIEREDTGRRRYLKKYFNVSSEDALLYHFVINTDFFSADEVAEHLANVVVG